MSDKDRQKKDHKRKDKENKEMREAVNERQHAASRDHAEDDSNKGKARKPDSARMGRPIISGGRGE